MGREQQTTTHGQTLRLLDRIGTVGQLSENGSPEIIDKTVLLLLTDYVSITLLYIWLDYELI